MASSERTSNLLARETSPYLLQHACNPVEWYPWGTPAFEKARSEEKPIFLSVGYSTCHWCHVMERESFENDAIAEVLNRSFVAVKVDREERPDIDRLYMTYVQATAGGGGWPMSVWLTPDLKPFFGGTYFPPKDRYGKPGFLTLLLSIERAWKEERERILSAADGMNEQLRSLVMHTPEPATLDEAVFHRAAKTFAELFDSDDGGFGTAPKFPQPSILEFLLAYAYYTGNEHAREMALFTLKKMDSGGIHDHLAIRNVGGGGFARYSTDERWHVPHFEKMLYDNAQLAVLAAEAYQITGEQGYAGLADDILNYVLCDMTDSNGGFYSAEDADSYPETDSPGKKEGAFYTWSRQEILSLLDPHEAELFCYIHGVEAGGNVLDDPHMEFTELNILYRKHDFQEASVHFSMTPESISETVANARIKLFNARIARPRPHLDDKILTSWNGLMISALSKAYSAFRNRRYLEAAEKAANCILDNLYDASSRRLLRRYRKGSCGIEGKADDYAFFIQGLLDLYEASSENRYLKTAVKLMGKQLELFFDHEAGGFFNAAVDDTSLPVRMKEDYDGAEPSPNSINVISLYRLADMMDRNDFREAADRTITFFSKTLNEYSRQLPCMLKAAMLPYFGTRQILFAGSRQDEKMKKLKNVRGKMYLPDTFIIHADEHETCTTPFLSEIAQRTKEPAAYVCEANTCGLPVTDGEKLEKLLLPTDAPGNKKG